MLLCYIIQEAASATTILEPNSRQIKIITPDNLDKIGEKKKQKQNGKNIEHVKTKNI